MSFVLNVTKKWNLQIPNVSNKVIIKLYRILRGKIKNSFHNFWKQNPLSLEPAEDGHTGIEIDESSKIGIIIHSYGLLV